MSKYATSAGVVTKSETFAKLIHHLSEAADQAAVLSHLHNTEDSEMDKLIAKGWLGIHELILRTRSQIIKLAATKFN